MLRPDDSARGIPSLCETVLSSYYRRIRRQLIAYPKRWLITGVAGFIGRDLPEASRTPGPDVVALDDFSTRSGAAPNYRPSRAGDNRHPGGAIDRAPRLLGYAPTQSLDDTLTEVLPWYLSRFGESLLGARFNRFHAARY